MDEETVNKRLHDRIDAADADLTAQELAFRAHSYRNFEPEEFELAADVSGDAKTREALQTVESGRLFTFLEATSSMFSRLDTDEKRLFTRRNPMLVMWMSVFNRVNDFNPYSEFRDLGHSMLVEEPLAKRTGVPERSARVISPSADVPPFERPDYGDRSQLESMMFRRRSYRNWSPFEFLEVAEREAIPIAEGQAGELDLFSPEIRQEIEDWPVEVDGRTVARTLLERPEAGRLKPMLRAGHRFLVPLDPDEMEEWAKQNPGSMVWISAWAFPEHQQWGPELLQMVSSVKWPPLEESG